MRRSMVVAVAVLAACGGGRSGGGPVVAPVTSSAQAMRDFMKAAADSNLVVMSDLFGTSRGSARETRMPVGFEKQLVVIQLYLRADSTRIVSDVAVFGDDNKRQMQVAIFRQGCMKQVPMVMVRAKSGGWLVNIIDLASAGNPARPCDPA